MKNAAYPTNLYELNKPVTCENPSTGRMRPNGIDAPPRREVRDNTVDFALTIEPIQDSVVSDLRRP
jgi:hypothetical protein